MPIFTVIGISADHQQRFAQSYQAATAADAEAAAQHEHTGLIIAGVVAGDVVMAA